jgi:uracil-DNA glycosylase family 4
MPVISPTLPSGTRILILGEAPGEQEDRQGDVFVGQTGQLLRSKIPEDWQKKAYWSNTVRCRPEGNRTPEPVEVACCTTYLEEDLLRIRPHAILGIGSTSLSYFWPSITITAVRGIPFPIQLQDGNWIWFYPTFHPSYVNRGNRANSVNRILPVFSNDLRRFFAQEERWLTPPNPPAIPAKSSIRYPKSLEEVKNLFRGLKPRYGLDIETFKLKPYMRDSRLLTAAFSDGDLHFAFPVNWFGNFTTWGIEAFRWCLSQDKEWVAHNASFELAWIWYNLDKLDQRFQDSAARARIKYQRKTGLSLNDQSKINLGVEIKQLTNVDASRIQNYTLEQVLEYNLYDAWACYEINERIPLNSVEEDNCNNILRSIRSTVTMELKGLPVHLKESTKLKIELTTKRNEAQAAAQRTEEVQGFQTVEGKEFSLTAPADVGKVIVNCYKIDLPKTDGGSYSTNANILEQYEGKGYPIIDLVLDFREVAKLLSTYVDPIISGEMLGSDGIIHPSYTTIWTATGRLSSENPNIQNFPKRKHREVRRQIEVPEGFWFVSFDYGQLEARTLVMASKDEQLRQDFINRIDIHSKWLKRGLELYPPYLDLLRRRTGETEEKKLMKAARDQVKTDFVFSSFYGSVARSISEGIGMPLAIVERWQREFWDRYKDVKRWIDGQLAFYLANGSVETLSGMVRNEILPGNEYNNNVIQGTGARIVLEAQNALWDLAVSTGDPWLFPRINIHDDISFIFPDDSDFDRRVNLVAAELVKPRFPYINLPLLTEGKIGRNWADFHTLGEWTGQWYEKGQLVGVPNAV